MKKLLISMTLLIGMVAGVMVLSSFTTPKQNAKTECSQSEVAADSWKLFRENVPYCDPAKKTCIGYGFVWVNTDTYQITFSISKTGSKYDLSEYTKEEGYNMRFWHSPNSKYFYVNIYVPKSVFE